MRSLGPSIFGCQILFVATCLTLSRSATVAQVSVDSTGPMATTEGVSTSGTQIIQLEPKALRLALTVSAEARDGESALQTLRDHTQRVEKELVILGALKESVNVSDPSVSVAIPGVSDYEQARKASRQQSVQIRAMNAMNGALVLGGNQGAVEVDAVEEADLPHVYTAKCSVTADWKISGPVDDKIRLMPSNLRRSILEKDLLGRRYTEKLNPQEQQMIQSVAGSNNFYSPVQQLNSSQGFDDPKCRFRFIAQVSDEMVQKAFETAFQKARKEAESMAKFANVNIHGAKSIRKVERASSQTNTTPNSYAYVVPTNVGMTEHKRLLADDEREIVDINSPTIVMHVFATFKLD
jgi:uncharacterized protein YggE